MSEAMLKKYGGNGLGEKPKSHSPGKVVLDAKENTKRVMQKMGFGETTKDNNLDFSGRVTDDACY